MEVLVPEWCLQQVLIEFFQKSTEEDSLFWIHTSNGIRHQYEIWTRCLSYQGMCLPFLLKVVTLWMQLVTEKT